MWSRIFLALFQSTTAKKIDSEQTRDYKVTPGMQSLNFRSYNKTRNDIYETLCPQPFACQEGS